VLGWLQRCLLVIKGKSIWARSGAAVSWMKSSVPAMPTMRNFLSGDRMSSETKALILEALPFALRVRRGQIAHARTSAKATQTTTITIRFTRRVSTSNENKLSLVRPTSPQLRYRVSSQIQFVSHVLPPSGEKDCSIRADFDEIFNQT